MSLNDAFGMSSFDYMVDHDNGARVLVGVWTKTSGIDYASFSLNKPPD